MGVLDILLLLCLIPAVWEGATKGFAMEIISLAAVFLGVIAAKHFAEPASLWLITQLDWSPTAIKVASYAVIFVAVLLLMRLLAHLVTKFLNAVTLGFANRLAGIIFGLVKAGLVLALFVNLFDKLNYSWNLVQQDALTESPVYMFFREVAEQVFPHLKELFSNITS